MARRSFKIFNKEIWLYCFYCLLSLFCSVDIIYLYINVFIDLTGNYNAHSFNMAAYLKLIFVVWNIISIIFNVQNHYRYRNFRLKGLPDNPMILYLICIPLLILSLVALLFIYIAIMTYISCTGDVAGIILGAFELINFVAIIILVIDTSGIEDTDERWNLNLSNFLSISLSVIFLWSLFSYNIAGNVLKVFIQQNFRFTNDTNCIVETYGKDSLPFKLHNAVESCTDFAHCCLTLLTITIVPYFIRPWQRNLKSLYGNLRKSRQKINKSENTNKPNVSNIENIDIMTNVTIGGVLVTVNIVLILWGENDHKLGIDIVGILELGWMFALLIFLINNSNFWNNIDIRSSVIIFDHIILWLTVFGDQTVTMTNIMTVSVQMIMGYNVNYNLIALLKNVIHLAQGFIQSVIMYSILHRRFTKNTRRQVKATCIGLNPFVGLSIMNLIFVIHQVTYPSQWYLVPGSDDQNMAIKEIMIISYPLSLLYRAYCAVIFAWLL